MYYKEYFLSKREEKSIIKPYIIIRKDDDGFIEMALGDGASITQLRDVKSDIIQIMCDYLFELIELVEKGEILEQERSFYKSIRFSKQNVSEVAIWLNGEAQQFEFIIKSYTNESFNLSGRNLTNLLSELDPFKDLYDILNEVIQQIEKNKLNFKYKKQ